MNLAMVSKKVARVPDRLRTGQEAPPPLMPECPDLRRLTRALRTALRGEGSNGHQIRVLDRKPNIFRSSFHSEIVTCQLADGSRRRVFCKYTVGPAEYGAHKGGPPYEASVYRCVLQPLPISQVHFYGLYTDAKTGEAFLFLEFLNRARRLTNSANTAAIEFAARWLGSFHRANESRATDDSLAFLRRYDYETYVGWAERTWLNADKPQRTSWLEKLCRAARDVARFLLRAASTVIHGEYTARNSLIRGHRIYTIDWESAAIAVGEIDIVCLTWRWDKPTVQRCELEYQRARWPQGAPFEFQQRVKCARLLWLFRWLGDADHSNRDAVVFHELREAGQQLGLIP